MAKGIGVLRNSSYIINFVVVRWQLLITAAVLWLAAIWLKAHYGQEDSNLWLVMNLFLTVLKWTIAGLFLLSLLTAVSTWLLFIFRVRHKKINVQVFFGDGQQAEAGFAPLTILIKGFLLRPLLGSIRGKLIFAGKKFSDQINIDTDVRKKRSLFRDSIKGTGKTLLHDRGIYDVAKIQILFCDMFNLIALPYTVAFTQQLYTLPKTEGESIVKAQPNAVEETKYRIEIPRRVEGEYINYKEFESGDNIRRIVWKIYAKSGQLVVRVPETKDPYASHLYFYVSYFQGFNDTVGIFDIELLNVYKDKVRSLFEALQKNGYDVRMPHDQELPKLSGMNEKKNELFQITSAHWQRNNPPSEFIRPEKAAFVCISSLTPKDEVEALVRNLPLTIPVVVVKLSEAITSPFQFQIKDIFFRPQYDPASKLRKPWMVAPLRRQLMANEREIERILNTRGNGWVTSSIDISK